MGYKKGGVMGQNFYLNTTYLSLYDRQYDIEWDTWDKFFIVKNMAMNRWGTPYRIFSVPSSLYYKHDKTRK